MKKTIKNEAVVYEAPAMFELLVVSEGVLCESGTESLDEEEGFWA